MTTAPEPGSSSGETEPFEPHYEPPDWYRNPVEPASSVVGHSMGFASVTYERPGCSVCGAQQVAAVSVKRHVGMVFWWRTRTADGPFCRPCGITLVREMTTRSLWQGWWGLFSLLINLLILAENLDAYRQLVRLPPSRPAVGRSALRPGKPVLRRPLAYVALIPAVWAVVLITNIALHS